MGGIGTKTESAFTSFMKWAREDTLGQRTRQLELACCKFRRHAFNLNTCKHPLIPLILQTYKVQIHSAGNKKGIETTVSSDLMFRTKNLHSNFYQALYHMTVGKTISRECYCTLQTISG